jgi:hypothetical protein
MDQSYNSSRPESVRDIWVTLQVNQPELHSPPSLFYRRCGFRVGKPTDVVADSLKEARHGTRER